MNFEKSFLKNSNFESSKKISDLSKKENERIDNKIDKKEKSSNLSEEIEEKKEKVENIESQINPLLKSNLEKLNLEVREFIESDQETLKTISRFIDSFEKYGLQSEKVKRYLNDNLKYYFKKEALSDDDFKKGFQEFFNYCFDEAIVKIQPLIDRLKQGGNRISPYQINQISLIFKNFFIDIGRMGFDSFMDQMLQKGIIDKSSYDLIYNYDPVHPLSGRNGFDLNLYFNNFNSLKILEQQDFPCSYIHVAGYFNENLKLSENIEFLDLSLTKMNLTNIDGTLYENEVKNLRKMLEKSNVKRIKLPLEERAIKYFEQQGMINSLNRSEQKLNEFFNFRNKNGELIIIEN